MGVVFTCISWSPTEPRAKSELIKDYITKAAQPHGFEIDNSFAYEYMNLDKTCCIVISMSSYILLFNADKKRKAVKTFGATMVHNLRTLGVESIKSHFEDLPC